MTFSKLLSTKERNMLLNMVHLELRLPLHRVVELRPGRYRLDFINGASAVLTINQLIRQRPFVTKIATDLRFFVRPIPAHQWDKIASAFLALCEVDDVAAAD